MEPNSVKLDATRRFVSSMTGQGRLIFICYVQLDALVTAVTAVSSAFNKERVKVCRLVDSLVTGIVELIWMFHSWPTRLSVVSDVLIARCDKRTRKLIDLFVGSLRRCQAVVMNSSPLNNVWANVCLFVSLFLISRYRNRGVLSQNSGTSGSSSSPTASSAVSITWARGCQVTHQFHHHHLLLLHFTQFSLIRW